MKLSKELREELSFGRLGEFVIYHFLMDEMGDIDPNYPLLRYVCDRFELNTEQRYWLAFLSGATYCAPTVYYIYNEFPDYENVDVGRLQRWWDRAGRNNSIFQTDRSWIRSRNQFVPEFESYREHIGAGTQESAFEKLIGATPTDTYDNAYKYFISVKYFGRFSMFTYLESVYVVTGFPMYPRGIDWAHARSSRNGLCFALGYDDLLRGHGYSEEPLDPAVYEMLDEDFQYVLDLMSELKPFARIDAWNVETTLCAYKKWRLGEDDLSRRGKSYYRYPGYYLDRQHREITQLQNRVVDGVDWSVLWDFRRETFDHKYLLEFGANNKEWSAHEMARRLDLLEQHGKLLI